jgi:hypothetical protein
MNKHDKLRVFTAFQHWLGTHYTNLPTDSGNMTERARRYLKENPQALDLFAVVGRSEQLLAFLEWYDSNVCQNDCRSREDLVKDFISQ